MSFDEWLSEPKTLFFLQTKTGSRPVGWLFPVFLKKRKEFLSKEFLKNFPKIQSILKLSRVYKVMRFSSEMKIITEKEVIQRK